MVQDFESTECHALSARIKKKTKQMDQIIKYQDPGKSHNAHYQKSKTISFGPPSFSSSFGGGLLPLFFFNPDIQEGPPPPPPSVRINKRIST